ncbi:hypothetical protein Fluta_2502 [Fluviicola taffensis DSM 16823]|uniref:DUF5723 domain-containing protein n=2 Tax=Fluviicola TaxID=332102 RepID=F2IDU5_FLUTR|nr:hypothetical protein Fluta_2502 [Fluviicola taffensis DSM 16823]
MNLLLFLFLSVLVAIFFVSLDLILRLMKLKLALAFLLSISFSYSQTQGVAFPTVGKGVSTPFVTDYHALGINTSALGWRPRYAGKKFTLGTTEMAFGVSSDSLNSKKLMNLSKTLINAAQHKNPNEIDYKRQMESVGNYAEAGVAINFDYNWLGFSYYNEKFGGIAFNIRESYSWYSKLNSQTTDLLFRGKVSSVFDSLTVVYGSDTSRIANNANISQDTLNNVISGSLNVPIQLSALTKGTQIQMLWSRSYNIGYGRKLFGKDSVFEVYAGLGARLITSMAMFNMTSDETGIRMFSSITPTFDINYGNVSGSNVKTKSKGLAPVMGTGYGIDLSASLILFNKLKIAVAVNNIGSVTYKRNVYKVKDTLFASFELGGVNSDNITQSVNQLVRDNGLLTLEGEQKYTVINASDFRFGVSFDPIKYVRIGLDIVAPFNKENPGSLQNPVYSVGADIIPVKWLQFSIGYYGGGIYKHNMPLGVTFILKDGAYEFGIASRDALSFFLKNGTSVSAALGFARVRF